MKLKIILTFLIVLALAAVANAQTKISGTLQCTEKGYTEYTLQVGDRPNHSFTINQSKCNWTKPLTIGGAQSKELVNTTFGEVSGNRTGGYGYSVIIMTTGDKCYTRPPWKTTTQKEGLPPASGEDKWTIDGGTGKLKGIKGKGTLKWKMGQAGNTIELEGEYELPK